eukprot:scaffold196995_cov18-Prasinocladus_malaysianus.AAC.1
MYQADAQAGQAVKGSICRVLYDTCFGLTNACHKLLIPTAKSLFISVRAFKYNGFWPVRPHQ